MSRILHLIRNFFDFSQPVIRELDVLDLVVGDHVLLMVSFRFKRTYNISVASVSRKYRMKEGSIIVKLDNNSIAASITISNLWRKQTKHLALKNTRFDERTTEALMCALKPLLFPSVDPFEIAATNINAEVSKPSIHFSIANLFLSFPNISVNQEQLTYERHEQGVL